MELYELTPAVTVLGISVEIGISVFPVGSVCIDLPDGGFPAPLGVGEFGGVTGGRSRVDPAPWVSTDPKRRFLGAVVALGDRDRKLYSDPGGRAGTSEAEADPKTSRFSMDKF